MELTEIKDVLTTLKTFYTELKTEKIATKKAVGMQLNHCLHCLTKTSDSRTPLPLLGVRYTLTFIERCPIPLPENLQTKITHLRQRIDSELRLENKKQPPSPLFPKTGKEEMSTATEPTPLVNMAFSPIKT